MRALVLCVLATALLPSRAGAQSLPLTESEALARLSPNNGIMLVSHIQHLMTVEGVTDFREAVERGAHERIVPILMTAMAAALALIPLALGGGQSGSEIQTPMAIVILCGLTTSTLLNMVVVPTLYLRYRKPARAI